MSSMALQSFQHAIQDSTDLLKHFDALNTQPPPSDIEVLKRASLVMALAALETYFEDRIVEAVDQLCVEEHSPVLATFVRTSLDTDLRSFHSPSADRVRQLYQKYLGFDVSAGWEWNHCDPVKARAELNALVRKRGDIAHRSLRPMVGKAPPRPHAVTRDDLRRHIHFITQIALATDAFLSAGANRSQQDSQGR